MAEAPIAFDLDGTLVGARLRQVGVAAEVAAERAGGTFHAGRFWRAKRSGATTAEALARLGFDAGSAAALAARWRERVESDDWLARDRPLPGVAAALRRLRADGGRVWVLTARARAEGAARSLAAAGLTGLVDKLAVVDPGAAARRKGECLRAWAPAAFIGDTESDGGASAAAGVAFVAVITGQRCGAYLRGRGYDPAPGLAAALQRMNHMIKARPPEGSRALLSSPDRI